MTIRAQHLRRAIGLSVVSIAWNGVGGSIAVYIALSSGSLALLGFGADARHRLRRVGGPDLALHGRISPA